MPPASQCRCCLCPELCCEIARDSTLSTACKTWGSGSAAGLTVQVLLFLLRFVFSPLNCLLGVDFLMHRLSAPSFNK